MLNLASKILNHLKAVYAYIVYMKIIFTDIIAKELTFILCGLIKQFRKVLLYPIKV